MRRSLRQMMTGIALALLLGLSLGGVLRVPLASLVPVGVLLLILGAAGYVTTRQRRALIILGAAGASLFFGTLAVLAIMLAAAP
ncbi:MAG: hypothetical protein AB1894_20190 [Chloroflexota bacterium]